MRNGNGSAEYNGKTKWNWVKNTYGSFDIKVDAGFNDLIFLIRALKNSIDLTEKILLSGNEVNNLYIPPQETGKVNAIWLNFL